MFESNFVLILSMQSPENTQFFLQTDPEILNLPTLSEIRRQNEGTKLSYFARLKT